MPDEELFRPSREERMRIYGALGYEGEEDLTFPCRGKNCTGRVHLNEETECNTCNECGLVHVI